MSFIGIPRSSGVTLSGEVAVVTGASSGIGRATAKVLSDEGAVVGLAARTESKLETLAEEIESDGGKALVLPTDVRDREQVASMIATTRENYDRLDILVNNAGVGHWDNQGIVDGDLDQWRREIEANLLGLMTGTHLAARAMREQGAGDIVNVSSLSDRYPSPEFPAYVASKYGVRGFTGSALRDLRDDGIRVTLIEPGEVATPMQPEEEIESTPMLDPVDVADAILYAVSRPDHVCINDVQIIPSGRG